MTTLFGIKNCDSVKKARKWLETHDIPYEFHDFRSDGLSRDKIQEWLDEAGIDAVLNKRSTTWKQLSDDEKSQALTPGKTASVIQANPTLVKRPVLETVQAPDIQESDSKMTIGFKADQYTSLFNL